MDYDLIKAVFILLIGVPLVIIIKILLGVIRTPRHIWKRNREASKLAKKYNGQLSNNSPLTSLENVRIQEFYDLGVLEIYDGVMRLSDNEVGNFLQR